MALALEIIPASMYENGHTEDADHELHIIHNFEHANDVFEAEAQKLVAPYDSEFREWIDSEEGIVLHGLLGGPNVRAIAGTALCGFQYRLSTYRTGKHTANG